MQIYSDIVRDVILRGLYTPKKNGADTISKFSVHYTVDVSSSFPLLTTRRISFKTIVNELLWFISGKADVNDLSKKTKIWDLWSDESGYIESPYGYFWRNFPSTFRENNKIKWAQSEDGFIGLRAGEYFFDQIKYVIGNINRKPNSRKHVVVAWHPANATIANVPPCPFSFVLNVKGEYLNIHVTHRSADLAVGVPHDIAVFSLLLYCIAGETGLTPKYFSNTLVDAHIYCGQNNLCGKFYNQHLTNIQNKLSSSDLSNYDNVARWIEEKTPPDSYNHLPNLLRQITREPFIQPKVRVNKKRTTDLNESDFEIAGYKHHPPVKYGIIP